MSVTDGVALFPRFPHLVEVGRIELPSAVVRYAPSGSSLSPPSYLPINFIHLA